MSRLSLEDLRCNANMGLAFDSLSGSAQEIRIEGIIASSHVIKD